MDTLKKYWIVILLVVLLILFSLLVVNAKPTISTATAEKIKNDWLNDTRQASGYYNVPVNRILAMIALESIGNSSVVGNAGEIGLLQLTGDALSDINSKYGTDFTLSNVIDGRLNIFAGAAYMRMMLDRFDQNLSKATRAYNAGANQVSWNPIAGYTYLLQVEANEKLFEV